MKKTLDWLEAKFIVSEEVSEALAEQLIQLGAFGIATQDPFELQRLISDNSTTIFVDKDFIEELPDFVTVKAYFAVDERGVKLVPCLAESENPFYAIEHMLYHNTGIEYCAEKDLLRHLQDLIQDLKQYLDVGKGEITLSAVKEDDWANSWKQYYHPLEITPELVICPSWEEFKADAGQKVIKMDPGSAFGTGSHETTSMCLKILTRYLKEYSDLQSGNILDLGCGSGILAIAAAKFGAENITAIDIDSGAVNVAAENAKLNDVAERINFQTGELKNMNLPPMNLILANLLAEVLANIEEDLASALSANGILICSGIVNSKIEIVDKAFGNQLKWQLLVEINENDWVARVYKRI